MSAPRRAIVLAAGRGSRLGELTAERPKPLLPLGDTTLIGRQLRQMEARGIRQVTVVVGYLGDVMEAQLCGRHGALEVASVWNHQWATTGSGASLLEAGDQLLDDEAVLLTHGDVVYADEILDGVLATAARTGGTVVAADRSYPVLTGDEVVAYGEGDRLAGVVKGPAPDGVQVGEFVGVSVFDGRFARAFEAFCRERARHTRTEDYEQPLLSDFVQAGERAHVSYTDDVRWMNVNYEDDLRDVRTHFAG